MHYGKYVAQYLKRTFFFDANPPLGKLLIALVAYLADFDGKTKGTLDLMIRAGTGLGLGPSP